MHRALEIDEIFTAVVQTIGDDERQSTMAALSLTCRALYDPASDVLWGDLPYFEPLLKCLPAKFVEQPLRLAEARELLPRPWARFLAHAARVKTLKVSRIKEGLRKTQKHMHLLALVRSLSGVPIFPRLHTLVMGHTFTMPRSQLAMYLPLFLGPEVCTVQLALEGDEKDSPPALDQILLHCPRLRTLELESMPRDQHMGALSCLITLEKLTCGERYGRLDTPRDLTPIAHLPSLRHLVVKPFKLKTAAKKIPKGLRRTPMFSTLETLELVYVRFDYPLLTSILQSITSTQLHTLFIQGVEWETDVDSLDHVLRLVAEFQTLRVLHLHSNAYGFAHEFPSLPLLRLRNLEELDLRLGNVIRCTGRGISELGCACPRLRRLSVFPGYGFQDASLWSLSALELFATHLPDLEFLSATFSPSTIPPLGNTLSPISSHAQIILMISVGDARTELDEASIERLAAYVFRVYPNAACALPDWCRDLEDGDLDASQRSWRRVSQVFERMRTCEHSGNPGPK